MTERLYYHDSLLLDFGARVIAVSPDGLRVTLDRSAFYPTSGGQPHDTGTLGEIPVVDVTDAGEEVIHVLGSPWNGGTGETVRGVVDRRRRLDHMQQHTGQHLISALLADGWSMPTVSVHFGDTTNTVDVVPPAPIDESTLERMIVQLERKANDVVAADLAVGVTFEEAASASDLRKPSKRPGVLRIVTIDGLDRSACGGTHVGSTGQIGGVLIRRTERAKGALRIEFVCGLRAVERVREEYTLLHDASHLLSAAPAEVPGLIAGLQRRVKELERTERRLEESVAELKAREIWSACQPIDGVRRIHLHPGGGQVRGSQTLARAITKLGQALVLVTSSEGSTHSLLLAASEDSYVDAGKEMKALLAKHGGRGGGSAGMAQGSVPDPASLRKIAEELGCPTE